MTYYEKNKEKCKEKAMEYQKKTNYAYQKKEPARTNRKVKAQTRQYYPLKNQKCIGCNEPAQHRHHYTNPPQIHKFLFLCKKCHLALHRGETLPNGYKEVIKWQKQQSKK